ncbi:GNAT superfamily N-acetyltransferase [Bradyrhizobium sp. LM2.7]
MQIRTGDTFDPRVVALLDHHITAARAQTAPGSAHALDLAGLRAADVAFWTGWDGEMLVATGALKALSVDHGEVKSMHTARAARQRGFGGRMLRHIIAEARARHDSPRPRDRLMGLFQARARALPRARLCPVWSVRGLCRGSQQPVPDARVERRLSPAGAPKHSQLEIPALPSK